MSSQKKIMTTRIILFIVNLVVVIFMSGIIYNGTELICNNGLARNFLEKIQYMPTIPWKAALYSISLVVVLLITMVMRETIFKDKKMILYLFSVLDIVLCVGVIVCLNMSNKGILLIAITNIILYIDGTKRRGLFVLVVILTYIVLDYDILSVKVSILSVNDYIQYYDASKRLYIFGIRNILTSVNEVIFIVFMVFVIQRQIEENQQIKELYGEIYQSREELKIVNIQIQSYAKKSEEMARIKERNRLAREIHDTIGHTLTGIATGLEACIELSEKNMERTKVQIVKIAELARSGLVDVRRSVSQLRPDALERFSLIPAIQKLSQDINDCTKTTVTVDIKGQVPILSGDEEETIYRIVQEGITNAVRHGNAQIITIVLQFKNKELMIDISDDGSGCMEINHGFGLKNIHERVQMLRGYVEFISSVGNGFNLKVNLPLRERG